MSCLVSVVVVSERLKGVCVYVCLDWRMLKCSWEFTWFYGELFKVEEEEDIFICKKR